MIGYFKAEPTEYARVKSSGNIKKEGPGICCLFLPYKTSVELVSVAEIDQPFGFREMTADKQDVSLQGGVVYRIVEPGLTFQQYNFSIDPRTKGYLGNGPEKLQQMIIQSIQTKARDIAIATPLEKLIVMNEELSSEVLSKLSDAGMCKGFGVLIDMLYFSAIKPQPEIAKALEAPFRESLLQKADEAIYARRAQAVEQERAIQQNEMQNQIDLEQKRAEFVGLEAENLIKEAAAKADAMKLQVAALKDADPAVLTAQGFYLIGEKAERIENLSITPELMGAILAKR